VRHIAYEKWANIT